MGKSGIKNVSEFPKYQGSSISLCLPGRSRRICMRVTHFSKDIWVIFFQLESGSHRQTKMKFFSYVFTFTHAWLLLPSLITKSVVKNRFKTWNIQKDPLLIDFIIDSGISSIQGQHSYISMLNIYIFYNVYTFLIKFCYYRVLGNTASRYSIF